MLLPARLEHEVDARLAHVQRHRLAQVVDRDEVAAGLGDADEQAGEPARPVVHAREQAHPPALRGLVALRHAREHAGVDVAAREHDHRRALRGGRDRARAQRRDADRAGALDHELRALEQDDHRVGDVVLADGDELVDPVRDERQRSPPGRLIAMPSAIVGRAATSTGAPPASEAG